MGFPFEMFNQQKSTIQSRDKITINYKKFNKKKTNNHSCTCIFAPGKHIFISRQRSGTRRNENLLPQPAQKISRHSRWKLHQHTTSSNFHELLWCTMFVGDKLVIIVWRHGFHLNNHINFVVSLKAHNIYTNAPPSTLTDSTTSAKWK
jgi:hypothetical protein